MAHERPDRDNRRMLICSQSSPVLSYITSGRMTDAEAAVLEAGLKEAPVRPANRVAEAAIRPYVSPANDATAMKAAREETVEVKKTVRGSNIDLRRDSECLPSTP